MDKHVTTIHNLINSHQWNRKILNTYWLVLLIALTFQSVGCFFLENKGMALSEYIIAYILIPDISIAVVLGLIELFIRQFKRYLDFIILLAGTFITIMFIIPASGMPGIYTTLMAPIFIAMFYFDRKKLLFSVALNYLSFLIYYFFFIPDGMFAADELIYYTGYLAGVTSLGLGIHHRGVEILNILKASVQSEQDLLVRNVIMDQLSKKDALTNLYNHKTFHEYLDKLVDQSERNNLSLQLAIFDIDNFKNVNDTYGHWVGDLVLKRVASTIQTFVTSDDFPARYGGEEFAVIFTDKTHDEAYQIVEHIRLKLSEIEHTELEGKSITISIGLQNYEKGFGKELLFKGADQALYCAKRTGKNKTVYQQEPIQ